MDERLIKLKEQAAALKKLVEGERSEYRRVVSAQYYGFVRKYEPPPPPTEEDRAIAVVEQGRCPELYEAQEDLFDLKPWDVLEQAYQEPVRRGDLICKTCGAVFRSGARDRELTAAVLHAEGREHCALELPGRGYLNLVGAVPYKPPALAPEIFMTPLSWVK